MTLAIGDKVIVHDRKHTFDQYRAWDYIGQVPKFQFNNQPEEGKEYTITFIGDHEMAAWSRNPEEWKLYVIDGEFIMDAKAFNPKV